MAGLLHGLSKFCAILVIEINKMDLEMDSLFIHGSLNEQAKHNDNNLSDL